MKKTDIAIIVLINVVIAFGLGAIRKWVSETASLISLGALAFILIIYLVYYYKKYGTFMKKKNDSTK